MMDPVVMKMLADANMAEIERQLAREKQGIQADLRAQRLPYPLAMSVLFLVTIMGAGWIL